MMIRPADIENNINNNLCLLNFREHSTKPKWLYKNSENAVSIILHMTAIILTTDIDKHDTHIKLYTIIILLIISNISI